MPKDYNGKDLKVGDTVRVVVNFEITNDNYGFPGTEVNSLIILKGPGLTQGGACASLVIQSKDVEALE